MLLNNETGECTVARASLPVFPDDRMIHRDPTAKRMIAAENCRDNVVNEDLSILERIQESIQASYSSVENFLEKAYEEIVTIDDKTMSNVSLLFDSMSAIPTFN